MLINETINNWQQERERERKMKRSRNGKITKINVIAFRAPFLFWSPDFYADNTTNIINFASTWTIAIVFVYFCVCACWCCVCAFMTVHKYQSCTNVCNEKKKSENPNSSWQRLGEKLLTALIALLLCCNFLLIFAISFYIDVTNSYVCWQLKFTLCATGYWWVSAKKCRLCASRVIIVLLTKVNLHFKTNVLMSIL